MNKEVPTKTCKRIHIITGGEGSKERGRCNFAMLMVLYCDKKAKPDLLYGLVLFFIISVCSTFSCFKTVIKPEQKHRLLENGLVAS